MTALDAELVSKLAGLQIRTRRAVDGVLSGLHESPHRGASAVFQEHREYRPGDDPRRIDWRAYARSDRFAVKHFEHETQLRCTLVQDASGSMMWSGASTRPTKIDYAATLLSAIAYVLTRQGDAVALQRMTNEGKLVSGPRRGPGQLEYLLNELVAAGRPSRPTDLRLSLRQIAEHSGRHGLVVIASDLLDLSEHAFDSLRALQSRGHETWLFHVLDPDEIDFPFDQPLRFVGLEGEAPVSTDARHVASSYRSRLDDFLRRCESEAVAAGARYLLARTDEAPEVPILRMLRSH